MKQLLTKTFVALFLFAPMYLWAGAEIYTGKFNKKAVGGYDTVAYFTQAEPVKGSKEHTVEYKGAKWFFSSAENKALFEANPEKYAPQYGGHCAWAIGQEEYRKAPGNPKLWRIVNDKLYLNYNKTVQGRWEEDIPGFIETADENWPKYLAED